MQKSVIAGMVSLTLSGGVMATSMSYDQYIQEYIASQFAQMNEEDPSLQAEYGEVFIEPNSIGNNIVVRDVSFMLDMETVQDAIGERPESPLSPEKVTINKLSFTDGMQHEDLSQWPLQGIFSVKEMQLPLAEMMGDDIDEDEVALLNKLMGDDKRLSIDTEYQYTRNESSDKTSTVVSGTAENIGTISISMDIGGFKKISALQEQGIEVNSMAAAQAINVTNLSIYGVTSNVSMILDSIAESEGKSKQEILAQMMKHKKKLEAEGEERSKAARIEEDLLTALMVAYSQDKQVEMTFHMSAPLNIMTLSVMMFAMDSGADAMVDNLGIDINFSTK